MEREINLAPRENQNLTRSEAVLLNDVAGEAVSKDHLDALADFHSLFVILYEVTTNVAKRILKVEALVLGLANLAHL